MKSVGAVAAALCGLVLIASCSARQPSSQRIVHAASPQPAAEAPAGLDPAAVRPTPVPTVEVTYRVDVRVADGDDFRATLAATMSDPRGWIRAGFLVYETSDASHVVVLAEGEEVDELCLPYETGGRFSCQNGPVVAINADRWRHAVPGWPLTLHDYRVMLLNHEMGHLLGQRHLPCTPGEPAPVMFQQSGGVGDCLANPWPLEEEIEIAARHDQPIAPGYGE